MVFVMFNANYGLGWFLSNRGDEVSMCHFKEIDLGLIFGGGIGGPKMVLEWSQNGFKMILE